MAKPDQPVSSTTIEQLGKQLGLKFQGDAFHQINSVSSLSSATKTDLCFIRSAKFLTELVQSDCGAVIVPQGFDQTVPGKTLLFSANPHLSFVETINFLQLCKGLLTADTIHSSAIIAPSAKLGENVSIAANSVIGERVTISHDVQIGAGCVIEDDVSIGANSRLMSNVTICFAVTIGEDVILQPGVVLGGDGFGLVYDAGNWVKIPHLGSVKIGDRVEIGANTTVDRGALDDTVIETGVKIDNQIQVGHNVRIGENTAIAACAAIAGSVNIGKNCQISGAVAITGHLSIADNVTVTAMSLVTKSITQDGTYSSGTPLMENRLWHRSNVRYKSLDKMAKELSDMGKKYK